MSIAERGAPGRPVSRLDAVDFVDRSPYSRRPGTYGRAAALELAVRRALGASRRALVRPLAAELAVWSSPAGWPRSRRCGWVGLPGTPGPRAPGRGGRQRTLVAAQVAGVRGPGGRGPLALREHGASPRDARAVDEVCGGSRSARPDRGFRAVRPQPVREAWSTGAEVAGAPVADAPSAPVGSRVWPQGESGSPSAPQSAPLERHGKTVTRAKGDPALRFNPVSRRHT